MIVYRQHRSGLQESMATARTFKNKRAMKKFIVKLYEGAFKYSDIVIESECSPDNRIGWRDQRYVCVKRFNNQDYMKLYGCPQCIGMCATEFDPI